MWLLTLLACTPDDDRRVPVVESADTGRADTGTLQPGPLRTVAAPDSFGTSGEAWTVQTGMELLDVAKAYYDAHPDDVDFLVVYTERPVQGLFAFALPVAHDIEGIGQQEVMALYGWDDLSPADAGSAGRLQQVQLMNDPSTYAAGSLFSPQDILTHETGHRWGANLRLDGPADPWVLTDAFWSHWAVYADVGGPSALGYGTLHDEGAGTFRYEVVTPLTYSALELYQQGLVGPDEVPPLFFVEGAAGFDPPTNGGVPWDDGSYGAPVSYSGTRVDLDIDDVIATHGPRVPAHPDAQRDFVFGFVLVCDDPDACDPEVVDWVTEQRDAWPETWSAATGDRATATLR